MKRYRCDVLVIGGGGAGLMAACQAAAKNVQVAIVNKGYVRHTGATIMANGSAAMVGDAWKTPGDSRELHLRDTISGGQFLNNQALAHRIIFGAAEAAGALEEFGALFERERDGARYALRTDGGHTYPRSLYTEDRIGRELVRALASQTARRQITIHENIMVTRIIQSGGMVQGAVGLTLDTQEWILWECASVIVATGGVGYAYVNTDNPVDLTGDGLALALACGIRLVDMEFVQFYPLGLLWPPACRGLSGAYSNHVRLYNAKGRRFMEDYSPDRMELTTRDILSGAIMREVREGRGSPHGGVYADLRHLPPDTLKADAPGMYALYRRIGFDDRTQRLEVAPTAHFTMGGMEVDANWATKLPGLFAAGEVCGGVHGANRVSQNALTEALVSGKIAGNSAAEYARGMAPTAVARPLELAVEQERLERLYQADEGMEVDAYRETVRRTLWEKVGILRDAEGLETAVEIFRNLRHTPQKLRNRERRWNQEVLRALENQNMAEAALIIALSALYRQETRGAHIRTDYPAMDQRRFLKNIYIRREADTYAVELRDVEQRYYRWDELGAADPGVP